MTRFEDVEFVQGVSQNNHTDRYWDGICSWHLDTGNLSMAAAAAENLAENCQETFTHLMRAVTTWNEFREYYGGADKDTVFAAMTPVAERLLAIKRAGTLFSAAVQVYQVSCKDFDDRKDEYDRWAAEWLRTWRKVESDHESLTEEEFTTKYCMPHGEKVNALTQERRNTEFNGPVWVIDHLNTYRQELASALKDIDMGDLSEMRFSHRSESLSQYESAEELAAAMRDSHIFGDADLSDEDIEQIAEKVFGSYDDLPYDYMDVNGVKWVFGPHGELVRAGSPMDPNLNAAILAVMNQDADWRQTDISFDGQTTQTVAEMATKFGLNRLGTLTDSALGKGVIGGWATAIVQVVGTGVKSKRYGANLSMAAPLLSDEEHREIVRKYVNQNLIVDGVEVTLGAGTAVLTSIIGPAGTVIGVAVTYVATGVTEYIVNEVTDESWDLDEMQDRYDRGSDDFEPED